MGWLIGGLIGLYLLARSNAASSVCVAPVAGGTMPLQPQTPCTVGPVHISPSQSLVCHATAVGCPTLPLPSTASEGAVGGGQPVNPLLLVQLANCNHTTPIAIPIVCNGLIRQPGGIIDSPVTPPVFTGTFHCDHITLAQQVIPASSTSGQILPTGLGQTILSTGTHTCGTGFKVVRDAQGNTFQVNC